MQRLSPALISYPAGNATIRWFGGLLGVSVLGKIKLGTSETA
jgi:hypothetical protein